MYNQVKELLFAALIRSCYHFCIGIPESLLFHPNPSIQFHLFHPLSHKIKFNNKVWIGNVLAVYKISSFVEGINNFRVEAKNT